MKPFLIRFVPMNKKLVMKNQRVPFAKVIFAGLMVSLGISFAGNIEKFNYNVFFGQDTAELSEKNKQSLSLIYNKITSNSAAVINVQGPYKPKCSNVYINVLSNERTNSIYQYFIEKGVQKEDVTMRIMRKNKPVTQLTDELFTNSDLTFQVVVNKH